MAYHYLLEIDVGYHLKRWTDTGTTGVYSHTFTDIDPAGVYVDGTQYGERTTYAACTGTQSTWYVDRGTAIYVHVVSNGDANTKTIKVDSTWHFAREGTVIPKTVGTGATVLPIFWEGRMETVPSISYQSNPDALGGGIVPSIGQVVLRNNDGHFDDYIGAVLWKNQPMRLYAGTTGTVAANFTLRQKFVADAPSITSSSLTIPAQTDLRKLRVPVNSGSTITIVSGGVTINNPAPVVFGPMVGIPAYYTDSSGTIGTYQIAAHAIGTVTKIWSSVGSGGTIVGIPGVGKVSAHPLAVLGQGIAYVNGTGGTSGGTALFKAGEIMQYLLASVARIPGTDIATSDFSTIDSERAINIMAWFGRNETVEECLEAVSRSSFTNWAVGRNGKFTARLIKNRPNNPIKNSSFETGTPAYPDYEPIENISGLNINTRINSTKMLFYNSMILSDTAVPGTAIYINSTKATWEISGTGSVFTDLSLHGTFPASGTQGEVRIYSMFNDSPRNTYECIFGTYWGAKTSGTTTIVVNRITNGVATQYGATTLTGVDFTTLSNKFYNFQVTVNGTGTLTSLQAYPMFSTVKLLSTTANHGATALATGYSGYGFATAPPSLGVDLWTWRVTHRSNGTIDYNVEATDAFSSLGTNTGWVSQNNGFQNATNTGNLSYDGTISFQLSKGSGTAGTLARAAQGTTLVLSTGTRYVCTLVAGKQSGDAGTFRAEIVDSGGNSQMSTSYSLGTGTWTRVSFDFTPQSSGTGTINLYPSYNSQNAGTCWVDLVEVYPVKTLNSWQIQDFKSNLENPINNGVAVRYAGTGTVTNIPLKPVSQDPDARDGYYMATADGTIPGLLYNGLETRIIHSLCYSQADAKVLADVVLQYYNKPRIRWEAEFLDTLETTINLWDTVYVESGRFPGIPDRIRLLNVYSVEDIHSEGIPKTRVGGEFVFDAVNDIMTLTP